MSSGFGLSTLFRLRIVEEVLIWEFAISCFSLLLSLIVAFILERFGALCGDFNRSRIWLILYPGKAIMYGMFCLSYG